MDTSRSIVAPLARAHRLPSWRTGVGVALALVFGRPDLWIIGALSVAARGGLLVLALPILTLPSPVGVGILLGPEAIQGGTPGLVSVLIVGVTVVAVALLVSLVLSAVADLMAYERFVSDPETLELRVGRAARPQSARRRFVTLVSLAGVYAVALLPAAAAAALLAERLASVLRDELLRPSPGVPLLIRLVDGARDQLLLLAVAVVSVEILGSLGSRHVLDARHGMGRGLGTQTRSLGAVLLGLVATPATLAARAAAGWLVVLVLVVPAAAALVVVWDELRQLYLASGGSSPELAVARIAVTVVFAAAWVAVTVLAGLASAIRAALWSGGSLR